MRAARFWNPVTRPAGVAAAIVMAAAHVWAAPSKQLRIDGLVQRPETLDAAALQALLAVTQTVDFLAGSTPQTHVYTVRRSGGC
jgi:hypothetical protein